MEIKRKTAIYCRAALTDEIAMARQERCLRAHAEERGCTDIIRYRDNGALGTTLDRPALNQLVEDIKAGEIGAVLVTDVSRIARTLPLVSEWRNLLREYGVALVIPADGETPRPANEIAYTRVGDYLLPNLMLSEREGEYPPLGLCGEKHKEHLRRHKPALYSQLLLSERLYPLCRAVDKSARERGGNVDELIYD
ncbi:MAG: recombinase family protein [Clostridiales Family XIII bacterium]|jgi:hypothetical protein|nr:recombinase family protein [Clostridiales Family XIII bacterium]